MAYYSLYKLSTFYTIQYECTINTQAIQQSTDCKEYYKLYFMEHLFKKNPT